MQKEASSVLVFIVLGLFIGTIAVWSYVAGSYVSNQRMQQQDVPARMLKEWRV